MRSNADSSSTVMHTCPQQQPDETRLRSIISKVSKKHAPISERIWCEPVRIFDGMCELTAAPGQNRILLINYGIREPQHTRFIHRKREQRKTHVEIYHGATS